MNGRRDGADAVTVILLSVCMSGNGGDCVRLVVEGEVVMIVEKCECESV